jgi:hypothetical protein
MFSQSLDSELSYLTWLDTGLPNIIPPIQRSSAEAQDGYSFESFLCRPMEGKSGRLVATDSHRPRDSWIERIECRRFALSIEESKLKLSSEYNLSEIIISRYLKSSGIHSYQFHRARTVFWSFVCFNGWHLIKYINAQSWVVSWIDIIAQYCRDAAVIIVWVLPFPQLPCRGSNALGCQSASSWYMKTLANRLIACYNQSLRSVYTWVESIGSKRRSNALDVP